MVEVARTALRLFGATLPDPNDEAGLAADFEQQMAEYSRLLNQRPMGDLIELADIADREQDGIIRLMAILTDGTYIAVPSLFPHIVMEVVNRSMRYGHNAMSAIDGGTGDGPDRPPVRQLSGCVYARGALAMRLNERYPNPARIRAQVTFLYAVCALHPRVKPLTEQIAVYQQAYLYGIDNGNLVFAGYARTMIPKTTLAALTVDKALEECAISLAFYAKSGSPFLMSERFCQIFLQRLKGEGEDPHLVEYGRDRRNRSVYPLAAPGHPLRPRTRLFSEFQAAVALPVRSMAGGLGLCDERMPTGCSTSRFCMKPPSLPLSRTGRSHGV